MQPSDEIPLWDFSSAIDLLKTFSVTTPSDNVSPPANSLKQSFHVGADLVRGQAKDEEPSLGNFTKIWDYLSLPEVKIIDVEETSVEEEDTECVLKEVRWRDEVSGADLEDNVEAEQHIGAASVLTRKRAARRARAKERAEKATLGRIDFNGQLSDSATDNDSDQDLNRLRRSPDRRAVIQDILYRPNKILTDPPSPPTSPSPPKEQLRVLKKEWPISNPFQWSASPNYSSPRRNQILPLGNLSSEQRKSRLITRLLQSFPAEAKYLRNKGLIYPEFTPLNTSDAGVHVFIDVSNVCLIF